MNKYCYLPLVFIAMSYSHSIAISVTSVIIITIAISILSHHCHVTVFGIFIPSASSLPIQYLFIILPPSSSFSSSYSFVQAAVLPIDFSFDTFLADLGPCDLSANYSMSNDSSISDG